MSRSYSCNSSDRVMNLLLLTLAVMVTYLNATLTGAQIFDDITLIRTVQSADSPLSLFHVLDNPKYFRPLGYMSFYLDLKLLGGDLIVTHFISIVIHICNSIMVYMLGLRLAADSDRPDRAAMMAAMLFALHPVNSEAVIWLSARFDLLCCFFTLITLLLVIAPGRATTLLSRCVIFTTFLCSLLAKEASLFLPAALFIYFIAERRQIPLRRAMATTAVLLLAATAYLMMRGGLEVHHGNTSTATEFIAAMGFYISKMINPFPLNFAIASINLPLQLFLLAALYLPMLLFLFRSRPQLRLPIALMTIALAPPLYAMLNQLPWVPYAERYLYIPMTGFVLLVALLLARLTRKFPFFPILCLLLMLGLPTLQRVNSWIDHESFWKEAINKAPALGTPNLVLAAEYLHEGRLAEAGQQLALARSKGIVRENAVSFANNLDAALEEARDKTIQPGQKPPVNRKVMKTGLAKPAE